jgi:hypothetical protein
MPIRSFVEPGAFDPEAIAEMSEALEVELGHVVHAWNQMQEELELVHGSIVRCYEL